MSELKRTFLESKGRNSQLVYGLSPNEVKKLVDLWPVTADVI